MFFFKGSDVLHHVLPCCDCVYLRCRHHYLRPLRPPLEPIAHLYLQYLKEKKKIGVVEVSVSSSSWKEWIYTCLHSGFLRGFTRARVGNVVFAFTMDIEATIAALETLFKESFKELTAEMAHSRLRVRVDDKRVRDLNSARHFLLNPKRTTSTYGRSSVFLNTRTGAAARRAIRYALYNVFEIKNFETTLRKLQFDSLLRAWRWL